MAENSIKYYLLIDTSTEVCTVALGSESGEIIAERMNELQNKHAEVLAPMAKELIGMIPEDGELAGVSLAEGPGSYTGLRIGAAYAKGLCWTRNIPLVSISTPELLTRTFIQEHAQSSAHYMPMIDARRMEVYTAIYDNDVDVVLDIESLILTEDEQMAKLDDKVSKSHLYYFGSGAEKAQDIMSSRYPNSEYGGATKPNASAMLLTAIEKITSGNTLDVAYWEPFYLKEYEAKKSTNKVLREIIDK